MSEKKEEREEKLGNALLKVALGYQIAEVTEEYAEVNGELKLTKRKKTKKDVPPDLKAVQMLLTNDSDGGFSHLTDEELEAEKAALLAALQETEKKTAVKKTVTKKAAAKKPAAKKTTAKNTRRK